MWYCPFKKAFRVTIFRFVILLVIVAPAVAQTISFGGKVGTPFTDPLLLTSSSSSLTNFTVDRQRYTVGPTFEFALPYRLSVEADALYKPLHYASNPFGFNTFQATTSANSWEIPVLVKGRFWNGMTRPFGNAGMSFRHVGGTTTLTNTLPPPPGALTLTFTQDPAELVHPWVTGYVAGGGVDFSYGVIHISPEVRYTRWRTLNFGSPNGGLNSNLNSVELLIGFTFTNSNERQ